MEVYVLPSGPLDVEFTYGYGVAHRWNPRRWFQTTGEVPGAAGSRKLWIQPLSSARVPTGFGGSTGVRPGPCPFAFLLPLANRARRL